MKYLLMALGLWWIASVCVLLWCGYLRRIEGVEPPLWMLFSGLIGSYGSLLGLRICRFIQQDLKDRQEMLDDLQKLEEDMQQHFMRVPDGTILPVGDIREDAIDGYPQSVRDVYRAAAVHVKNTGWEHHSFTILYDGGCILVCNNCNVKIPVLNTEGAEFDGQ